MKTTQGKAVAAFTALKKMAGRQMDSFVAYKLFCLKKALWNIVEFQTEQEQKLVKEIGGTLTDEGKAKFDTTEQANEFIKRHKEELENMECDVEIKRYPIFLKDIPELCPVEIEILEPFIDWKE